MSETNANDKLTGVWDKDQLSVALLNLQHFRKATQEDQTIMSWLLKQGADIDYQYFGGGKTAISIALSNGDRATVELLLGWRPNLALEQLIELGQADLPLHAPDVDSNSVKRNVVTLDIQTWFCRIPRNPSP